MYHCRSSSSKSGLSLSCARSSLMHFRYSISMHRYYFQTLACVSSRYWLCHCTTINSRAFHRNTGHKCHRWSIPKLMNIQVGRVSLVNNSLSPSIWSSPSSQACEVSFFHEWHGDTIQNIVGFAQRIKCTHISNLTIFLTARKVGNFRPFLMAGGFRKFLWNFSETTTLWCTKIAKIPTRISGATKTGALFVAPEILVGIFVSLHKWDFWIPRWVNDWVMGLNNLINVLCSIFVYF